MAPMFVNDAYVNQRPYRVAVVVWEGWGREGLWSIIPTVTIQCPQVTICTNVWPGIEKSMWDRVVQV